MSSIGKIAVVGLGQLGGSIAAGLKKRRLARVVGIARRDSTARRALSMGIVDEAGTSLDAVEGCEVVILATPVRTLNRQVGEIGQRLGPSALLTDVGSTKEEFLKAVRKAKLSCSVVAGHPMAGTERAGLDGADPDLFVGRPWILIPAHKATRQARSKAEALARGLGSFPLWMDGGDEHDYAVALVSHVPYLIAYALMGLERRAIGIAGNSFRDATRVASSDVDMVLDFLLTNSGNIRRALGAFRLELSRLERALGSEPRLRRLMESAKTRRSRL